ncbi:hypothetical protein [Amycolatopsis sp. lyj-346]|uniref:hypothetical protein n=1 Tax=Amycolatopsis sp. lyj-346 TaxID=2789289 RepID=UPI00397AFA0A
MPAGEENRSAVVDRVNVALIAEAVDALAKLQERTGLKKVDLVNRALLVYEFVDAELKAGKQVLVRDRDGRDQLVKIFL